MNYEFSDNSKINTLLNGVLDDVSSFVHQQDNTIHQMNLIGQALSTETNLNTLLNKILSQAKKCTNSDGGTIYLMNKDEKYLEFSIVETSSINVFMGGDMGTITWPAINLYNSDGSKNKTMVAAKCALDAQVINIDDVYKTENFNFEGTKEFDEGTGFHSKSMLVIPMKNSENEIIGVCQLINKMDSTTNEVISFTKEDEESLSSLASQAAIAITRTQLIQDLKLLLEAFIKSIASAIDAKSPYTGGHVRKVSEITMLIVHALNDTNEGKYSNINYNADQLNELRIAALMHDIGKITTPEYVVDKARKLETIFDRIEIIKVRFEVLKRDAEISLLKKQLLNSENSAIEKAQKEYETTLLQLDEDLKFLECCNVGGEFLSNEHIRRLEEIAQITLIQNNQSIPLLNEDELANLSIKKGTLSEKERDIINNHAQVSLNMLNTLPFPKKLSRVPEIAGGHHEKLNGKGYPLGLDASELSLEARVLALADIFEALTASDRPYKKANTVSEAMKIINFMVRDGELDADLVEFFLKNELHITYAKRELHVEQLDL